MPTEIVINATREETRVALLENRGVAEFYFDRKKERGIMGNVYKGRVVKVLPGMQAAFVDIATEKAAFLYVADIITGWEENDLIVEESEDVEEDGMEGEESSEAMAPIIRRRNRKGPPPTIEALLKEGQEVIVQVSKEPIGTKGPRVTMYVSLPGRYLVYMPFVNHVGISRRIGRPEERRRLKEMIHRLGTKGSGYIVRTVSAGMTDDEFKQDVEFLSGVWQSALKKSENSPAPVLIHIDLDLIFRTVRDAFTKEVTQLVIDSKIEYDRIQEFVGAYLPDLAGRVMLWDKDEPIFDSYGLEMGISKAKGKHVWLKSGGYLVIEHTEALTVIDINTGRYVGKRDLEETILKTNLEAAREIAYQLRLRNIGGIIIIDFIDMEREKNREKVFNIFLEAISNDRAKTHVLKISELGLIQMSRERTREDLMRTLCEPCPYCEGRGHTKSPTTLCYEIFREIRRVGTGSRDKKMMIGVHPAVANLLFNEERHIIETLERESGKKILVKADANLHIEQYHLVTL